ARQVIGRLLDNLGVAEVIDVASGAGAFEHLSDNDSSIDLIICDIEMLAMTGWEFVYSLRVGEVPRYKDIPVLMLTAADTPKNVRRGKYSKVDAFLVKPPELDSLRSQMSAALGLG
ncbi:MAG: response regulator, partial [Alphaproteobacteria bacterium]